MKKTFLGASLLAIAGTASPAIAETGDVTFTGIITATCTIAIDAPGTIVANPSRTVFSSTVTGGDSGAATVTATDGSFTLSVSDPAVFTSAPATGSDNVDFDAMVTGTGASSFTIGDGAAGALNQGQTTATVDLTAAKLSGTFAPGSYTATVVLTCE